MSAIETQLSSDYRAPTLPDRGALVRDWAYTQSWHRRMLARLGLQGKLVAGFVLMLLCALCFSAWIFVSRSRETLSDLMGEQAAQISQSLALASRNGMSGEHPDGRELSRIGRDLLKSRNIVLVAFLDPAGRPVSVECRDPDYSDELTRNGLSEIRHAGQVKRLSSPSLGSYAQATSPIFSPAFADRTFGEAADAAPASSLLGYVAVGVSQAREEQQLAHVSFVGLAAGSLIFLVALPAACWLVRRILMPIRQLVSASERLASGDYEAQVAIHRPDDIGDLARAFNLMVLRVRDQQEQLLDANKSLENKVCERTAALESANQRLSAEISEKEDFLRAVSHDLNAPLRNIGGMATMLLVKYRGRFDEDVVHRLERIQKNVEVETDLISELLELSRIKTRRQTMEASDLDALANDVAGVFEADLKARGIRLMVETPLPAIVCERSRMRQVFQNLVDNAIKYMGEGQTREICIGAERIERADGVVGEVRFYVRDTGMGIDADDLGRVFSVFRRGRNAAMTAAGKGVGLSSVKSIVENYGGRIWVDSVVGEGSTFWFTIGGQFLPEQYVAPMELEESAQIGAPALLAGAA